MADKGKGENRRRQVEERRRQLAERRAAFEVRMAEARRRLTESRAAFALRLAEARARLSERRRAHGQEPKPRPFRKPPREEGGEPVPAIPKPKPTPLTGGAAAPIERKPARPAGIDPPRGARRGRLPTDAESRLNL